MLHLLRRHPVPVRAHFDFTLALTFAAPLDDLRPLLYRGLELDAWEGLGFVAVALVRTRELRPEPLPAALGGSFFLSGYRLFTRYRTRAGRNLRGLQILRSDTDRRAMTWLGNLMTHYRYSLAEVQQSLRPDGDGFRRLEISVETPGGVADLDLTARVGPEDAPLPATSPFPDGKTARRFAGPMPFTFSYEPETDSMIRIEGQRRHWEPRRVTVDLRRATFLESGPLGQGGLTLASAYWVEDVPYRWTRGVRERLPS